MNEIKPLNWTPKPGVGFTVVRRDDGGMTLTFTDLSDATINDWRKFAMEHLLGVDRRTRNLYDLRAVQEIPEKAIRMAVEANSDPSARNIRVAVVVADEQVANAIREVAALALPGTASAMKLFTDINEAEAWLARPLDQIPESSHKDSETQSLNFSVTLVVMFYEIPIIANRQTHLQLGLSHLCDGNSQHYTRFVFGGWDDCPG